MPRWWARINKRVFNPSERTPLDAHPVDAAGFWGSIPMMLSMPASWLLTCRGRCGQ